MAAHNRPQSPAEMARKARQERAVVALAMGRSVTEAARLAGVNRWTLYEWMKRPDFRTALEEAAREQAALSRMGLDAVADVVEAAVSGTLRRARTMKSQVRALQRILDLYEGIEDRVERRLREMRQVDKDEHREAPYNSTALPCAS